MRIKKRDAFACRDVLADQVLKKAGLPSSRLSQSVKVGPAVGLPDAEDSSLITKVGLSEEGDALFFVLHTGNDEAAQSKEKGLISCRFRQVSPPRDFLIPALR